MGYTTDFGGSFKLDKPLDNETRVFLTKLADTRRMKRKFDDDKYGVDGEFYVDGGGMAGQDEEESIVEYNTPPSTQPGLWCQWVPNEEGTEIAWDGGEKFYAYTEWLRYIIEKVLKPKGYVLKGAVEWYGEDSDDRGMLVVKDNVVTVRRGEIVYHDTEE
jgi:hypothetical protein